MGRKGRVRKGKREKGGRGRGSIEEGKRRRASERDRRGRERREGVSEWVEDEGESGCGQNQWNTIFDWPPYNMIRFWVAILG